MRSSGVHVGGRAEVFRGGRNLLTPHPPETYGDLLVVRPGPLWEVSVIVPQVGQTVVARGGERVYAYSTPDGTRADGFALDPGDRATLVREGLPHALAEWRVARAAHDA